MKRFRVGSYSNTRAAMCQAVSCPSALAVTIRLANSAHCRCPSEASRFNNGDHIAMERHGVSQVGIGVFRAKERAMTSSDNSSTDISPRPEKSGGRTPSKPATPSPAPEKISGAGPAVAEHSKDAKAPRGGRQPGAYVKD
jgi:hypothetical protein